MSKKEYIIKDGTELVLAMSGGVLYGNTPAEVYDASTFVYPIKVTIDTEAKTFVVEQDYKEPVTEPVTEVDDAKKESNKGLSKGAIAGIVVGVVLGIALIVGVVLACVL